MSSKEDNSEQKWKIFCYRFVGRSRRLAKFKDLVVPNIIIDKEKELIQKAYDEMRDACLSDKDYLASWENNS